MTSITNNYYRYGSDSPYRSIRYSDSHPPYPHWRPHHHRGNSFWDNFALGLGVGVISGISTMINNTDGIRNNFPTFTPFYPPVFPIYPTACFGQRMNFFGGYW